MNNAQIGINRGLASFASANSLAYILSRAFQFHATETSGAIPGSTIVTGANKTYFDASGVLQTAGANTARINKNPATGLWSQLNEPLSRTQILPTADIRDMTTANWTLGATMTRARNQVGADGGANLATLLTGGAVAATNTITTTIVAAASSRTYSPLIKRVAGNGPILLTQDNFATTIDISSLLTSSGFRLGQISQSQLNAIMGIRVDTPGDQITVDCNQFEAGTGATSRMLATGAFDADVITVPTAGLLTNAAGFSMMSFTPIQALTGAQANILSTYSGGNDAVPMYKTAAERLTIFTGPAVIDCAAMALTVGTKVNAAVTWNGLVMSGCVNGGAVGSGASGAPMAIAATLRFGNDVGGLSNPICMEIHGVMLGTQGLSNAYLASIAS